MSNFSRRSVLAVGVLTISLGLGGGLVAGAISSPKVAEPAALAARLAGDGMAGGQRINDPKATAPGYQRNARGLTYGSGADAPRPDLEPDLIWVVTDSGGSGYVYRSELDTPPPPQTSQKSPVNPQRTLVAYAEDGTTAVGTFTVGAR